MTIEIGVILPTSTPDPGRPILGDVTAGARLAEELGLDSIWSTDHLVASAPILDGTIVLATAAGATERIPLG
ncbi:LLM class flavin-dependent oxidoreductase [Actinoplanes bogorensis]|uniref:LLM class flavin-dependent oxidoreductase n=1 Tax=Paractinoplanes bogorensis TaxID=1610840 RepID=A0ABS5Z0F1_9ACTN|nr:LLM class flavin-dependent oxidoreductase [Actinoplanes bogorensis]MBU2667875.1 LLM class flavin-dependent oxidoreductase [Actinoplanes bogorensis]